MVDIFVLDLVFAADANLFTRFMVANRSVGTGLTASAVISSWMWAYVSS